MFGLGSKNETEVKVLNPNTLKTKNFAMDNYRDVFGQIRGATNKLNSSSDDFLRAQINREKSAVNEASKDTKRQMKDLIARRGLNNSSIGLGQMNSLNKTRNEQISSIGATLGERERALKEQNLGRLGSLLGFTQPGMSLNVERTIQQKKKGGLGGLGGLAGAGIGGYFGGAAGAKVGAGLGSYFD